MAKFYDQLSGDVKTALKAGEKDRVTVLRMLINSIKQEQDAKDGDLSEQDEMQVLLRAVKSRRDAVAQAREHGREDIAVREEAEITLVEAYLPQQMTAEELRARVQEVAAEVGYAGPRDTGKFMSVWMARYRGQADGKAVQAALKGLG